MVRWMRSGRIASGKGMQAIQFAKEITEWANKKYNIQMKVFLDTFGDISTIRWIVDYENLATLEKIRNSIFVDQEYWQRLNQGADLFIEGSSIDTAMTEI